MPAQLLLVNPSTPRRRLRRSLGGVPSPAQLAARQRFAEMVRAGAFKRRKKAARKGSKKGRARVSFYDTPFGQKILAKKARKEPGRLAVSQETPVVKKSAKKKASKKMSKKMVKKMAKKAYRMRRNPSAKKREKQEAAAAEAASVPAAGKKNKKTSVEASPKKRRSKLSDDPKVRALQVLRNRLRRAAKKKKGAARSILTARARALSLQVRAAKKARRSKKTGKWIGLSPTQRAALRRHGLLKVNPSIMSVVKDMAGLLPQAGATVAGLAIAALAGAKLVEQMKKSMPQAAADPKSIVNNPHIPAVVSVAVGALGYIAARLLGSKSGAVATFANKLAPSLFIGGVAAATVHTLASVKTKDDKGVESSLGKRLGLPIGEYVLGEYVIGQTNYVDVDGNPVAVDGQVGIFGSRTIGDYVPYSVTDDGPREGARGRMLEASASDILREELAMYDGKLPIDGNLSGSIFDE
jgi:hypothetical protein